MIVGPALQVDGNETAYSRAIARLMRDMDWTEGRAHAAIAEIARAYGVYLDDVARAVVDARTVKRGLAHALRPVRWNRRAAYGLTE